MVSVRTQDRRLTTRKPQPPCPSLGGPSHLHVFHFSLSANDSLQWMSLAQSSGTRGISWIKESVWPRRAKHDWCTWVRISALGFQYKIKYLVRFLFNTHLWHARDHVILWVLTNIKSLNPNHDPLTQVLLSPHFERLENWDTERPNNLFMSCNW